MMAAVLDQLGLEEGVNGEDDRRDESDCSLGDESKL